MKKFFNLTRWKVLLTILIATLWYSLSLRFPTFADCNSGFGLLNIPSSTIGPVYPEPIRIIIEVISFLLQPYTNFYTFCLDSQQELTLAFFLTCMFIIILSYLFSCLIVFLKTKLKKPHPVKTKK